MQGWRGFLGWRGAAGASHGLRGIDGSCEQYWRTANRPTQARFIPSAHTRCAAFLALGTPAEQQRHTKQQPATGYITHFYCSADDWLCTSTGQRAQVQPGPEADQTTSTASGRTACGSRTHALKQCWSFVLMSGCVCCLCRWIPRHL